MTAVFIAVDDPTRSMAIAPHYLLGVHQRADADMDLIAIPVWSSESAVPGRQGNGALVMESVSERAPA